MAMIGILGWVNLWKLIRRAESVGRGKRVLYFNEGFYLAFLNLPTLTSLRSHSCDCMLLEYDNREACPPPHSSLTSNNIATVSYSTLHSTAKRPPSIHPSSSPHTLPHLTKHLPVLEYTGRASTTQISPFPPLPFLPSLPLPQITIYM